MVLTTLLMLTVTDILMLGFPVGRMEAAVMAVLQSYGTTQETPKDKLRIHPLQFLPTSNQ